MYYVYTTDYFINYIFTNCHKYYCYSNKAIYISNDTGVTVSEYSDYPRGYVEFSFNQVPSSIFELKKKKNYPPPFLGPTRHMIITDFLSTVRPRFITVDVSLSTYGGPTHMRNMINVHKSGASPCMYILWFSETEWPNCCKLKVVQSNLFVQKRNQNMADCSIFINLFGLMHTTHITCKIIVWFIIVYAYIKS